MDSALRRKSHTVISRVAVVLGGRMLKGVEVGEGIDASEPVYIFSPGWTSFTAGPCPCGSSDGDWSHKGNFHVQKYIHFERRRASFSERADPPPLTTFPTRSPSAHVGSSGGVPSWILAGCGHRCWVDLFERVEKEGGVRRGLSGHLGKWTRFKYSIIKWKTLFQLYEAQK